MAQMTRNAVGLIAMTGVLMAAAGLATSATSEPPAVQGDQSAPPASAEAKASEVEPPKATVLEKQIDVVFVLDTTGSMGGLIEGAKQKIWSIAEAMTKGQPRPKIRMGLVGYRDRGDAYITKRTALTDDLDAVYTDLMAYKADGGGDGPESVNQALREAVDAFDWQMSPGTLRLVYLVGDAPPHMDYKDDVKYPESCERAAKRGIIVNTIQCGSAGDTAVVWQEISRAAEGEYFAIGQDGGVAVVATPYDSELASLGARMEGTLVGYGTTAERAAASRKVESSAAITARVAPAAMADRASYKASEAGRTTLLGSKELVQDIAEGKTTIEKVPEDQLPEELKRMTMDQRREYVAEKLKERQAVQEKIRELTVKRAKFISEETVKLGGADSFDAKVLEALAKQAKKAGINYTTKK